MERYFKRKTTMDTIESSSSKKKSTSDFDKSYTKINLGELLADPSLWTKIYEYNCNIQDQVRRAYLLKGPCQPQNHKFPLRKFETKSRWFNP